MHHDQGALGSAAYYDAMYRQLSILERYGREPDPCYTIRMTKISSISAMNLVSL